MTFIIMVYVKIVLSNLINGKIDSFVMMNG